MPGNTHLALELERIKQFLITHVPAGIPIKKVTNLDREEPIYVCHVDPLPDAAKETLWQVFLTATTRAGRRNTVHPYPHYRADQGWGYFFILSNEHRNDHAYVRDHHWAVAEIVRA
ncbi:hypothetical protein A1O3_06088 [Capronia epimyces CBS 606.96]|uniref:Uncharacterized protein n=1 Tax=Capronia epimyces CBS 606.96 TaxID=1182542 RepID=W9XY14_9EURO|nr:uncharacterized protein A1O3_06088 [Capronia epimyces CBS 606.96]EXJ82275.1 hypothetical protein A1O3_06088 [Capronia epimyces CBS 606.96]